MDIAQANDAFGIPGVLSICDGEGGLPLIRVENAFASASISVQGGQVLSYCPVDAEHDLLFVSRQAYFQADKAIKGGIPVCWPWFGPDPEQRGRPDHGFVRNRPWQLLGTEARADGGTRVLLGVRDDEHSLAFWSQAFALELEVTIGETLDLALVTQNTGQTPVSITQALHAYLNVGDVRQAQVLGLAGHQYLDKLLNGAEQPSLVQSMSTGRSIVSISIPRTRWCSMIQVLGAASILNAEAVALRWSGIPGSSRHA